MNKNYIPLLLIIICTFLTAFGQIAWKIGSKNLALSLSLLSNYALLAGFVLYGLGAILLMFALRHGNLSFVQPFLSLGFVWASFLAFFYLGEDFPLLKILSIGLIITGTFFIFRGDVR